MKTFLLFTLLTGSAFAATNAYDVKLDLSLDGKHVASPRFLVKEGEAAAVTQKSESQERFVELVATESLAPREGILMKFTVGTIDPKGVRTILARPEVIVKENVPARLTEENHHSGKKPGVKSDSLSLSVTAKKISI